MPAEPMAILVATAVSIGMGPSLSWISASERRRWSPPPRYPQANPLELTMSIVSSVVRSGRKAS